MTMDVKIPTFDVSDMTYGVKELHEIRSELIDLRNKVLAENNFDASVLLSHTVSLLYQMADHVWGEEWRNRTR